MKIISEKSLCEFDFWCGAATTANYLTWNEITQVELMLEELFPDGMDETELNDFFWFEDDTIANWLGFDDFEELIKSKEEVED